MILNAIYEVRDGYLYVKPKGDFDSTMARIVFYQGLKEAQSHNLNKVLCDITLMTRFDVKSLSLARQYDTSKLVALSLPKSFALAILQTPQQQENHTFCVNIMLNRGAKVKATTNLKEALEWLGIYIGSWKNRKIENHFPSRY